MELTHVMAEIQKKLKRHDTALQQMLQINEYIIAVNQQAFQCAINSSYVQVMRLMLRKSIAEGVKRMLKIYRLKQWLHVQNMVHQLSLRYSWRHGYRLIANMDGIYLGPNIDHISKEDIAAQSWLVMQTEFYRGA